MDNTTYLQKFNSLVKIINSYGGSIGDDAALRKLHPKYDEITSTTEKTKVDAQIKERYLAYCYLRGADNARYGKLKEGLDNDYSQGNNKYPHTITEAYQFLTNYTQYKPKEKQQDTLTNRMSFVNNNNNNANHKSGDFEEWVKTATCHNCNKKGHIRPNCPELNNNNDKSGSSNANVNKQNETETKEKDDNNDIAGTNQHIVDESDDFMDDQTFGENHFCFHMKRLTEDKMKNILLLDTGSSDHLFCEEKMLKNIKHEKNGITFSSNGGIMKINKQGLLPNTNQKA